MKAPVVVFAYNRADHLEKTLTALAKNVLAKETDVYVFVDGPKTESGAIKTRQVVECAEKFQTNLFSSLTIFSSDKNKGLAKSVIGGVTQIISQYGKVIVLEDDSVSSPYYLTFMNNALEFYAGEVNVWSVGGFTVPMNLPSDYNKDVILTQRVSSCAWGIWKDRWEKIDWSETPYKKFHFSMRKRRKFNRWGKDRASMYDDQMNARINSWAIRFDYAMFTNNAFNVIPRDSLIKNIGIDGSGTHSREEAREKFQTSITEMTQWTFEKIEVDERIRKEFCKPFHISIKNRAKRFLGNLFYRKQK